MLHLLILFAKNHYKEIQGLTSSETPQLAILKPAAVLLRSPFYIPSSARMQRENVMLVFMSINWQNRDCLKLCAAEELKAMTLRTVLLNAQHPEVQFD